MKLWGPVLIALAALVCGPSPGRAERTVAVTYDLSGSMCMTTGAYKPLNVGELRAAAEITADLVFWGEPYALSPYRDLRGGRFVSMIYHRPDSPLKSPYWRPGDGLVYMEYGGDIRSEMTLAAGAAGRPEELKRQMLNLMPWPRACPIRPAGRTTPKSSARFSRTITACKNWPRSGCTKSWPTWSPGGRRTPR